MLLSIPAFFDATVNSAFLGLKTIEEIPCYVVAITIMPGSPLLLTVHTDDGALYGRLPLRALTHRIYPATDGKIIENLCPFDPPSTNAHITEIQYLKNYDVIHLTSLIKGKYLFTVDYIGDGFAETPTQTKTHNVIAFANGQIGAFPNNHLRFVDNFHAYENVTHTRSYKRQRYREFL